jgi:hypothetical protein
LFGSEPLNCSIGEFVETLRVLLRVTLTRAQKKKKRETREWEGLHLHSPGGRTGPCSTLSYTSLVETVEIVVDEAGEVA